MTAEGAVEPKVTVAVVSWNTRELLARCLDSLGDLAMRGVAEVVVVDNASTDGSAELVQECYPWARLIAYDENLGFGSAVNRAADRTDTEWIVAANADTEVTSTAVEDLMEAAARRPSCGAALPRLELPDGSIQESVFAFPRLSTALLAGVGAHRVSGGVARRLFRGGWDPEREGEVEWGMAAFLLLRRAAFEQVGRFDERQWMYGEDLDLCWRLHRARWQVIYVSAVTVRHSGGASTSRAFGAATGTLPVLRAHYAWLARRRGRWAVKAFSAVSVSAAVVRILLYSLGAMVGVRGARDRRRGAADWLRLNLAAIRAARSALSDHL